LRRASYRDFHPVAKDWGTPAGVSSATSASTAAVFISAHEPSALTVKNASRLPRLVCSVVTAKVELHVTSSTVDRGNSVALAASRFGGVHGWGGAVVLAVVGGTVDDVEELGAVVVSAPDPPHPAVSRIRPMTSTRTRVVDDGFTR
jgi:hypothetical protein